MLHRSKPVPLWVSASQRGFYGNLSIAVGWRYSWFYNKAKNQANTEADCLLHTREALEETGQRREAGISTRQNNEYK